jgi:glutathione S-transferase
MSGTPQILYFDIRGRAEPIRLLLEDAGVPYVDKQVSLDEWGAIRGTTPFHRMPVYSEDDKEIPESFAIMNYLGRKHGLLGGDETA